MIVRKSFAQSLPVPRKLWENMSRTFDAKFIADQRQDFAEAWHEWLSLMTPAQRNRLKRLAADSWSGLQPWTVWRLILKMDEEGVLDETEN